MFRKQFLKLWQEVTGDSHFAGQYWKDWRHELCQQSAEKANTEYMKYYKEQRMKNITATGITQLFSEVLAPLPPATCTGWYDYDTTPPVQTTCSPPYPFGAQKGNNPMNSIYNSSMPKGDLTIQLAPAASASVSTKSDTAIQRDYLMSQFKIIQRDFDHFYGTERAKLRKTFNLDVDNTPKTSQELIDAIKGGKFTLDQRILDLQAAGREYDDSDDEFIGGVFAAIEWDGPKPDKTGYDAAHATFTQLLKDAERTIIVKSPDEGLAAIQALEAWTPTGKAS